MTEPAAGPPSREQLLTVEQHVDRGALVLTVRGQVDAATAPRLRAALDGALRSAAARRVVVDLLAVTFLSSAGLAVLTEAAQQAHERREPLRIVVDHHRPVLRPIQITGLDDVLMLSYSVEEALTA